MTNLKKAKFWIWLHWRYFDTQAYSLKACFSAILYWNAPEQILTHWIDLVQTEIGDELDKPSIDFKNTKSNCYIEHWWWRNQNDFLSQLQVHQNTSCILKKTRTNKYLGMMITNIVSRTNKRTDGSTDWRKKRYWHRSYTNHIQSDGSSVKVICVCI